MAPPMFRSFRLTATAAVLFSAASCSQESNTPQQNTQDEPTIPDVSPEDILRSTVEFYRSAQVLQVREKQSLHVQMTGENATVRVDRTIIVEKPNRIVVRSDRDKTEFDIVSDGEKLITCIVSKNEYSEEDAPESIDDFMTNPTHRAIGIGPIGGFAFLLLSDEPFKHLMDGVTEVKYMGRTTADGVDAHRLRLRRQYFDLEIWINTQGDPLVSKMKADLSRMMVATGQLPAGTPVRSIFATQFMDWKFDEPAEAGAFNFKSPEGATKVDSFFRKSLLGKAAPPLELDLLDGGRMNLQDHLDNQIVILDFWATWCGPCVEEMPLLVELFSEYQDSDVVFYAVNMQEEPDIISQFLENKEWDVTVALDSGRTAADDYGITGLPTLVLIDKSGTVQALHVGYNPQIQSVLRQELDDLLAGKNLVK